jgi:hypothetical protein
MPFASKSQLRTCFARRPKGWNCEKWLAETPDAECLPERVGEATTKPTTHSQCRKRPRTAGPEISAYYRGPRGGVYFYADGVRCYVPASAKARLDKRSILPSSQDPFAKK